jgi:hypothetical protein
MNESYSIRMLKKSAFEHEILNNIDSLPIDQQSEELLIVKEYLKDRIKNLSLNI